MKSKEYWENAALEREEYIRERATERLTEIMKMYDDALTDIKFEINRITYNYGKRFELDEVKAKITLAKEVKNYNLEKLIEMLENAETEQERNAVYEFIQEDGLSKRAYASRVERFNAVRDSIKVRILALEIDLRNTGSELLKEAYKTAYYKSVDDTAKGFNIGMGFNLIDENALSEVIDRPWQGSRFSSRVWRNTQELADQAQEILGRYITSGRSISKAADEIVARRLFADELSDRIDVAKERAITLMRTEEAHARSMGELKSYNDMGIKQYKYLATLEYRTCGTCASLDGKTFEVKNAREGENYPPIHPRCRCTTTIDMDYKTRLAYSDPDSRKSELVDGNLNYKEWLEGLPQDKQNAIKQAKKKARNKSEDTNQYEKYKAIYGKEIPNTLAKFQEMKYNDVEKWNAFKDGKQDLLNQMSFNDMSSLVGKLGNKEVRIWYKTHDENIVNIIDKSKPLELQARQACELRNRYKMQARDLMKDQEERETLDIKRPPQTFDEMMEHKKQKYGLTGDEAYKDIIRSTKTTNAEYDVKAGLKGDDET